MEKKMVHFKMKSVSPRLCSGLDMMALKQDTDSQSDSQSDQEEELKPCVAQRELYKEIARGNQQVRDQDDRHQTPGQPQPPSSAAAQ